MSTSCPSAVSLADRFLRAAECISERARTTGISVEDENAEQELRKWLNGNNQPLEWAGSGVSADEWFFLTTLYGEMTFDGQRTRIRKFLPKFVAEMGRDIRNFNLEQLRAWPLRSHWMRTRLARMARVLRERQLSMGDYAQHLRKLEGAANARDPMPALDAIVCDHRATGWKTLSCFVRDCIQGNCFPIDSRVENELRKFDLPNNERLLVSLCLQNGLDPRPIARVFYQVGGAPLNV